MRRAFTLAEVLVALLLGVVVLALVVSLLHGGAGGFARAEERLDAREAAHQALFAIRTALADARDFLPSDGGRRLSFGTLAGQGEVRLAGRTVTLAVPGAPAKTPPRAIATNVESFAAVPGAPGFVSVRIAVARPPDRGTPRPPIVVIDEIRLAPTLPDRTIPWRPMPRVP